MTEDIRQIAGAALFAHRSGDAMQFAKLVASLFAVEDRESITYAIVNPPNLGRPKAKRDEFGATPHQNNLAASYEAYGHARDAGISHNDAMCAARKLCNTTNTEFLKVLANKKTEVNEITRRRGTFRQPSKEVLESLKN